MLDKFLKLACVLVVLALIWFLVVVPYILPIYQHGISPMVAQATNACGQFCK